MPNGYGYKTQESPAKVSPSQANVSPSQANARPYQASVSPYQASASPYQGYGQSHGGYAAHPYQMGGQMPTTLPASYPTSYPASYPTSFPASQPTGFPGTLQAQAMPPAVPSGAFVTQAGGNIVTMPAVEESYVENILRLNRGKMGTFYMTYENNREWNAKIFKGIVEAAGRDHIIISDPTTGMRFLLLTLNLDYVTFDEPIAYEYPFQGSVVSSSTPLGMATLGTVNSGR